MITVIYAFAKYNIFVRITTNISVTIEKKCYQIKRIV